MLGNKVQNNHPYCEKLSPSISDQICTTSWLVMEVQGCIKQQGEIWGFEHIKL
jgi:hypothetical protein